MGVHPLPNIDLYWSSDPFFCVSEIADVMTSKRFKMILKNLHLNDNSQMPKKGEPQFDKLYKIRPLIKTMNETFQSAAKNTCSQSIDECMVKFKGRSSLKQFLPNKPMKRGFKYGFGMTVKQVTSLSSRYEYIRERRVMKLRLA